MHHYDPSSEIQDYLVFGEYGDVNPSITDSSTYTFLNPQTMNDLFDHEIEGCFLYSRHWNPTNKYLADALAKLEDSEAAIVTASGMGAISCAIFNYVIPVMRLFRAEQFMAALMHSLKTFYQNLELQ